MQLVFVKRNQEKIMTQQVNDSTSNRYGKDQRYYDLLSYIASNAIAGEIMAVENYSEMVPLIATTTEKIETVSQANDEAKHIQMLSKLGKRLSFKVKQKIVEPPWLNIRKHFSSAVDKNDLAACLIIQDLMVESMAIMLYKMLSRDTDPDTTKISDTILRDELDHLNIGINRIKDLLDKDDESVHDSLVWAHHRVMPELFSMISTSCHSLCDVLDIECGGIGLDSLNSDIEQVKLEALEHYIETLDRTGFDTKVTVPLIASMSSYGVQPPMADDLRSNVNQSAMPAAGRCC
jgi:fatty aldehyde decarbonylase